MLRQLMETLNAVLSHLQGLAIRKLRSSIEGVEEQGCGETRESR